MCWKGKQSNYQEIYDFIDNNTDDEKLKEFEAKLEDASLLDYNVYMCRFKQHMTFAEIVKKLNIESTARVAESLNAITLAIEIYLDIVD